MTLLRLSYLVLLWLFVWAAISVLRQDLYSVTRVTARGRGAAAPPAGKRAQQDRPPGRLRLTAGKLVGTSVPLGRSAIVVGRDQACTLVLDDDYASSRHARFFPSGEAWLVEDLGSTNGTFVNGRRITTPTQLEVGHEVRIGQSVMEIAR